MAGFAYAKAASNRSYTLNVTTDISSSVYRGSAFNLTVYATDGNGCLCDVSPTVTLALLEGGSADADDKLYASSGGAELTSVTLSHGVWTSATPVIDDGSGDDASTTIQASATGYTSGSCTAFQVNETFKVLGSVQDATALNGATFVVADSDYAYLVRSSYNASYKLIAKLDISDTSSPSVSDSTVGDNVGNVQGLAHDSTHIYIAATAGVFKYAKSDLSLAASGTTTDHEFANGIVVDGSDVYVALGASNDADPAKIAKLSGSDLSIVDTSTSRGADVDYGFRGLVNPGGGSYLYSVTKDSRIYQISKSGLSYIGYAEDATKLPGTGVDQSKGNVMHSSGGTTMFIAYGDDNRVTKFTGSLTSSQDATNFDSVYSVWDDGSVVYASNSADDTIHKLSRTDLSIDDSLVSATYLNTVRSIYLNDGILHCAVAGDNRYTLVIL